MNAFLVEQLEGSLADVERHLLSVLDMRNNEAKPIEGGAHLRRLSHKLFISLRIVSCFHRFRCPIMRYDDRGRREKEMASRVVAMRFSVDQKTHRQRREFLNGVEYSARIGGIMSAVDEHHALLGEHDAAIGIEIRADVNVNAILDLANVRP